MENETTVAILTPYLSESIEKFVGKENSKEKLISQVENYGYDPFRNFGKISTIKTQRDKIVNLLKPEFINRKTNGKSLIDCIRNPKTIFSIAGSTEDIEDEVMSWKGSGAIVARYSIFYGGRSGYTGRSASQSGYSLDIPKDPDFVRELLLYDDFLDAISVRKESDIKSALESLNRRLLTPILITDYLKEALNINKYETKIVV